MSSTIRSIIVSKHPHSASRTPTVRANRDIRVSHVRLVDESNVNQGVVTLRAALDAADAADLDLVEVAPSASPPVCRIIDVGRYRYEQSLRDRALRRSQRQASVKDVKLRVATGEHDRQVRLRQARDFLEHGHKVRFVVMLRGRQIGRPEDGLVVLTNLLGELGDHKVDQPPTVAGRDVVALVSPAS